MANLINTESISLAYGERSLLRDVSLGVDEGDRIGVVGLNGSGKTTLLEILAGLGQPDAGRVSRARGLRHALVTQHTEVGTGITVRQAVLAGYAAEHEWAGDPGVRSIVDGLGIAAIGLDTVVDTLSGGERRRVALAAALVAELDLVVLDEPTNHLDVEGIQWLADHLLSRKLALVVVTHDRWFLDTVCSRTWEVVDGSVAQYEGGYADWVYARAERERIAAAAEEKRRNLARKELAWLHRGAKARTSKPKYRVEAAEALIADEPKPRDTVELHSFARRRLGKTVLELEDVTVRVPTEEPESTGQAVLDHATWRIGPGERIGIVGINGSGKTTVLRLLAGEITPEQGRRVQGSTVRMAHLHQELEDLRGDLRVLEAVEEVARRVTLGKHELTASQLAERFGFGSARQWTRVSDLSGGERRRLQLARLLMAEPNVLLLDEPTNDLDIDTLQQLEDVLDSWPGTLVVVSHDRYLLERACDSVYALFGGGGITHLPGGIDEYLRKRSQAADTSQRESAQRAGSASGGAQGRSSAAQQRSARKELARIERRLDTLQGREKQLHDALANAATDHERLAELDGELKDVLAEKEQAEQRWLDTAEYVD